MELRAWHGPCVGWGMMRNRAAFTLATATFATLLAGCFENVASNEVSNDALYADVALVSRDGVSTDVSVRLTVGGPLGTDVQLQSGDRLVASAQGQSITLGHTEEIFGGHRYTGVLPRGGESVAFSVDYLRGDTSAQAQSCGRTNAVGSFAIMAKPFELSPMMSQARLGSPLTVAWSNAASGKVDLTVRGDCIAGGVSSVADSGVAVLDGSVFAPADPKNPSACTVQVTARRCLAGQPSAAFGEGGSVKACQERSLSFRIAP